jgi:hypothetical protein
MFLPQREKFMLYKRAHRVPWRIVDGKAVLVSIANSEVMVLNDTGTEIWGFLSEERGFEDIVEHLLSVYECDRADARKDVDEFIKDLTAKEAIDAR